MLFPRISNTLFSALVTLSLSGLAAEAEENNSSPPASPPPTVRTLVRSEEVPDATNAKPIQRAFFSVGTNRFAFVIPFDFKLDASIPEKLVLTSPDCDCFISVQLIKPETPESGALVVDSFRNQAQDDFPGAIITDEFGIHAANHSGPAYELNRKNASGLEQLGCVGFVPVGPLVMKFSLLSDARKYSQSKTSFHCLLRSFQSNESGKLEVLPVSGAS